MNRLIYALYSMKYADDGPLLVRPESYYRKRSSRSATLKLCVFVTYFVRLLCSRRRLFLLGLLLVLSRDAASTLTTTHSPFSSFSPASFSVWPALRPLASSGSSLCLLSDGTLLMASLSSPFCAVGMLPSPQARAPHASPYCVLSTRDAASKLLSLHIVPAFMAASVHERKRLTVLAQFRGGLICDVTRHVVWQAYALSVWRLPASTAFFLLQATLANRVSNRAFIQGTEAQ